MKVNEIFLSIQGEGITTGLPTVFLRFTGCNLRCTYCDTGYSYNEGTEMTLDEIVEKVESFGYKRLCITGGEPLLQEELPVLLDRLAAYNISIETNGSVSLTSYKLRANHTFNMDMKVPSSGEADKMIFGNFDHLRDNDEVKFVLGNRKDYEWAQLIIEKYHKKGIITLSPVFGRIEPKEIINWMLEDRMDVRFQLQLHKVIWNPNERGV